ncbi:hypothetical protein [Sphingomonas corticis]|uniref:Uncharacterized protein n=1 Tax=Sphingomonas corticis TaxID=2722791 RepID=A0ABX1CPJ0_9SPHN|nr:hypothetical protein [Sphingomonas corticis]NJR79171.1 hypothetical protein [Sphingomonas corticis]
MSLSFDGRTFIGGRFGDHVEAVLAHAIGAEFRPPLPPCARRAHDHVLRALREAGLCPVSYEAVRRRMAAMQRWFDGGRVGRMVFKREIPVNLLVLGEDGSPVGRPLITLSGSVSIEGERAWLDAHAEVSFPRGASRTPMAALLPAARSHGERDLAELYSGRPERDARARRRDEVRRRARILGDADRIMGIFREPGSSATFGYLVSFLGSRGAAGAALRYLFRLGTLRSADGELRDESVITRGSDDVF